MNPDQPLPAIPSSLTLEVSREVGIALVAIAASRRQTVETVALIVLEEWAKQQIHSSEVTKRMLRGTPWEIR